MSICYDKLWKLAIDKNLNKTQLRDCAGITSATLARLSKNQGVSLEALERICIALECNIGEIIEFKKRGEINEK
ncbi:helix-turn-helix domain-containing protein [Lactococcus allomyrinae]|uniref:XRE family transcriptional regulator n=1 Tax=Lactococcus allomyrinae TaxID=2419773 RepID=A0A387BG95_9LACT|nr:helix-turn-helix transcriptional regulator [Lactococcus allomyrinae]AYG01628.1 XRE family transcriptional regulator [Lactococcus allomyrinae]